MKHSLPRLVAVATLGLAAALACGSGGSDADYGSSAYRKSGPGPGSPEDYGRLDGALVVPPDRAVIRVDVRVKESSFEATSKALTAETARVVEALSGCTGTVLDARSPSTSGWEAWQAYAEVRVDVDLGKADGVGARREAIEACLQSLEPVLTRADERELSKDGSATVVSSDPMLLVDEPWRHAGKLVQHKARTLSAVQQAAAEAGAAQLHADDYRCVPTGEVIMGSRRLSGVELVAVMDCRVEARPADVVADEQ